MKQLEEGNKSLEQENLSLKRKLQALEQAIASPSGRLVAAADGDDSNSNETSSCDMAVVDSTGSYQVTQILF